MFTLGSAERHSTQVVLDTDEESLAGYIQGLSSSNKDTSSIIEAKSPRTPRVILTIVCYLYHLQVSLIMFVKTNL